MLKMKVTQCAVHVNTCTHVHVCTWSNSLHLFCISSGLCTWDGQRVLRPQHCWADVSVRSNSVVLWVKCGSTSYHESSPLSLSLQILGTSTDRATYRRWDDVIVSCFVTCTISGKLACNVYLMQKWWRRNKQSKFSISQNSPTQVLYV